MSVENQSDSRWQELNDTYRRRGLVLMLGAGVSKKSGIPMWDELFRRTAARIEAFEDPDLVQQLLDDGFSLPVVASLLEERCEGVGDEQRTAFVKALREALYEEFFSVHNLTPPIESLTESRTAGRNFIEQVRDDENGNTTLRSVGALCALHEGNGFKPNPKIHAIVTQNVDWLLQAFIRAHFNLSGKSILVRTIERPSAPRSRTKIPLYHMHGLLRFDEKADDPAKEAQDRVVMTEQDYYDFFNDATSIFNYTLLYLMREHSFLFVGLSMTDENLRRLLHYSKRERVRSLKDEQVTEKSEIREKVMRHFAILRRSATPAIDRATEDTLAPLGTHVLWVDEFEDIPEKIEEMYDQSAGQGQWQGVYDGVSY